MPRTLSDATPADQIFRQPRFFGLRDVLKGLSAGLRLEFENSKVVGHPGDIGEEREIFLKNFLNSGHFPAKYAVSKGHGKVLSSLGKVSLQTDLVLYDGFSCPVLRDGENHQYFPIESVYAVIQVKSSLSKSTLIDAAKNIASVKQLAPYESVTRSTHFYAGGGFAVGDIRPIPIGVIFAYSLAGNSLDSLQENLAEYHASTNPNEWVNLICVLDKGVIYNTFDLIRAIDSRDLVKFSKEGKTYRPLAPHYEEDALLDFYLSLIGALGTMDLLPPPLHHYVDLPIVTDVGHSYKMMGYLAAWKCPAHGLFEVRLSDYWVNRLAEYLALNPPLYEPAVYIAAESGQKAPMKMGDGSDANKWFASTYIYTEQEQDPLPLLRIQYDGQRPIQPYHMIEIDGKRIILPQIFVKKADPLFAACPNCPIGTPPVHYGGLDD